MATVWSSVTNSVFGGSGSRPPQHATFGSFYSSPTLHAAFPPLDRQWRTSAVPGWPSAMTPVLTRLAPEWPTPKNIWPRTSLPPLPTTALHLPATARLLTRSRPVLCCLSSPLPFLAAHYADLNTTTTSFGDEELNAAR